MAMATKKVGVVQWFFKEITMEVPEDTTNEKILDMAQAKLMEAEIDEHHFEIYDDKGNMIHEQH